VLDSIIAGPRTARLTKTLVYDQQAATAVFANQNSKESVGEFEIVITPRPGHSLTELEQVTDGVIAQLKSEGPTAEEIQRATAGLELQFVSGLQSNLGKALRLADGAGVHGNAAQYQIDYAKSLAVTAGDVKRVANKYLTRGRVVLSIAPMGKLDQASKAAESRRVQ
jgi:zinc protease